MPKISCEIFFENLIGMKIDDKQTQLKFKPSVAEFFEKMGSNAWFGGATAVITVLAGGLASFFTDEIKTYLLPFFGIGAYVVSWKATVFWICVALAGGSLGLGQWSQGRRNARATAKLESMVVKLETLPTGKFLPDWQEACRISLLDGVTLVLSETKSIEQVEQLIRDLLGSILQTAQQFDKIWHPVQYSANIMVWREADAKSNVKLEAASPKVIVPWFQGDVRVSGVLELIPGLSTTLTAGDPAPFVPDIGAEPVVLPVPVDLSLAYDVNRKSRSPVLPGAAWAHVNKQFAQFPDVSKFAEWIDERTSIDTHAANAMKDYFFKGDGDHIKSFGSIPVLSPAAKRGLEHLRPIAVLNLHSNEPGLLEDNGQTLFVPLLEPFLVLISILLVERNSLLKKHS